MLHMAQEMDSDNEDSDNAALEKPSTIRGKGDSAAAKERGTRLDQPVERRGGYGSNRFGPIIDESSDGDGEEGINEEEEDSEEDTFAARQVRGHLGRWRIIRAMRLNGLESAVAIEFPQRHLLDTLIYMRHVECVGDDCREMNSLSSISLVARENEQLH